MKLSVVFAAMAGSLVLLASAAPASANISQCNGNNVPIQALPGKKAAFVSGSAENLSCGAAMSTAQDAMKACKKIRPGSPPTNHVFAPKFKCDKVGGWSIIGRPKVDASLVIGKSGDKHFSLGFREVS